MQTLHSRGGAVKYPEDKAKEFVRHIKTANDIGIQKFLMIADHGDILIFLKIIEDDQAIKDKFYGNMSDRLGKILSEVIDYIFKDGVSPDQFTASVGRLMALAEDLERSRTLVHESVIKR
jgi:flagellar motor switch protein FliG